MSQFDVYRNDNPNSQAQYPYLLDVQSDLLSQLQTTVVIPLMAIADGKVIALTRLNPVMSIGRRKFILDDAGSGRHQSR